MSDNTYPHDKKKRLAERIAKLKRKEDMIKIAEIIRQDNKNITENQNGLFMFFHAMNDETYIKIDSYLKSLTKKKSSDENTTSENKSDKEFTSYTQNDFPDQEKLNAKLKYSNKEKNIIKRQRYDDYINSENNDNIYQKFNVDQESEEIPQEKPKPKAKKPVAKPNVSK
jgi:hypothetical protein